MRISQAMQNRNCLLCVLASAIACVCAARVSAGTACQNVMSVDSVDYAFDGGSISFTLSDESKKKYHLIFLNPKSPERTKFPKRACLWVRDFDTGKEKVKPKVVSGDVGRTILSSVVCNSQKNKKIKDALLALLLSHLSDIPIYIWGADAVEAIEQGHWSKLLRPTTTQEEDGGDPFDF